MKTLSLPASRSPLPLFHRAVYLLKVKAHPQDSFQRDPLEQAVEYWISLEGSPRLFKNCMSLANVYESLLVVSCGGCPKKGIQVARSNPKGIY